LPERPRRLPATRGFFFDPSLEGRLGTVRTVLSQLSTKIGDLSLERRDLALQRSDQLLDFGGKTHPTLDSDSQPQVSYVPPLESKFNETVTFRLTTPWELPLLFSVIITHWIIREKSFF
jgi:hypothetical protein